MSTPKSLMTHYLEGALISRELHDMMHQYAADARFEVELKGYEDNLTERWQGSLKPKRVKEDEKL